MPEDMPDRMPENMSEYMPEELPVRKCINVMVVITRSKVIFHMFLLVWGCYRQSWVDPRTRATPSSPAWDGMGYLSFD